MKLIVKPVDKFQLLLDNGEVVKANRPSIVSHTDYLQRFIDNESVKKMGTISAKADDKDFEGFWTEANGDEDFAIQSYKSSLSGKTEQADDDSQKVAEVKKEEKLEAAEKEAAPAAKEVAKAAAKK